MSRIATPSRRLAKLAAIRVRREDRARQELAVARSRLSQAEAELASAQATRDQIAADLPRREIQHMRHAVQLKRPEDSRTAYFSALLSDRAQLARQVKVTDQSARVCDQMAGETDVARRHYLAALRQREATDLIQARQKGTEGRHRARREEDLLEDQARSRWQGDPA